jgi:hypothetical protein
MLNDLNSRKQAPKPALLNAGTAKTVKNRALLRLVVGLTIALLFFALAVISLLTDHTWFIIALGMGAVSTAGSVIPYWFRKKS